MRIYPKSGRSGQSLIEVMVALSLLTVGFLGVFNLLSRSLFLNKTVSNEATATYLAAEGVELAKNLIDHDVYLSLAGAGGGWGNCFKNGGDFELDYMTQSCPIADANAGVDPLWYHATTGLYDYNENGGGTKTNFARDINILNVSNHEIRVSVKVLWNTGPTPESVTVEDHFYNWQP
jgi:type II secretory pathway component PulJ